MPHISCFQSVKNTLGHQRCVLSKLVCRQNRGVEQEPIRDHVFDDNADASLPDETSAATNKATVIQVREAGDDSIAEGHGANNDRTYAKVILVQDAYSASGSLNEDAPPDDLCAYRYAHDDNTHATESEYSNQFNNSDESGATTSFPTGVVRKDLDFNEVQEGALSRCHSSHASMDLLKVDPMISKYKASCSDRHEEHMDDDITEETDFHHIFDADNAAIDADEGNTRKFGFHTSDIDHAEAKNTVDDGNDGEDVGGDGDDRGGSGYGDRLAVVTDSIEEDSGNDDDHDYSHDGDEDGGGSGRDVNIEEHGVNCGDNDTDGDAKDDHDQNGIDESSGHSNGRNCQVFLVVDPEVIRYIFETVHKDEFNKFLKEQGIEFDWKDGSNLANFNCIGDTDQETLTSRVRAAQSFVGNFRKYEIPMEKNIWKAVKKDLLPTDGFPKIQYLEADLKLKVIAKDPEGKYRELIEEKLPTSSTRFHYSKGHISLLKKTDFVQNNVKEKCKQVDVYLDEENEEVRLQGPRHELDSVKEEFLKQRQATHEKRLNDELSQNVVRFLATEKGRNAVEDVLQTHRFKAVIEFETFAGKKFAKILANSAEDLKEAVARTSRIVHEEEVEVDEKNLTLKSHPEWNELCSNEMKKNPGMSIQGPDRPSTLLIGFTEQVKSSAKRLQQFLDENSIRTEQIHCRSWLIKQYIKVHRDKDLRLKETELVQSSVEFFADETKDDIFHISGQGNGIHEAKKFLTEIINNTEVNSFTIEQPGLKKTFERIRDALLTSSGTHCLLVTESVEEMMQITTANGQTICRKIGNISEERAHTVVIPTGECFDAIRMSYLSVSPVSESVPVGGTSLSPRYIGLPFQRVIHTHCTDWSEGLGEKTLRTIVKESLQKVANIGGGSIAFTVIGTGRLRFPANDACSIMVDEVLKFFQSNSESCFKDVRLIAFHQNKITSEALRQVLKSTQESDKRKTMFSMPKPVIAVHEEIRRVSVQIKRGNLIHENTDAIVNVIGPDMNMNAAGDLSRSLAKACGPKVQEECRLQSPQQAGEVVMTTAGNLPTQSIIHLIPKSKENISKCIEKCLQLADRKGLGSISLPAIGTGGFGLSAKESANVIFQALSSLSFTGHLGLVSIVILHARMIESFRHEKEMRAIPSLASAVTKSTHTPSIALHIEILKGDLTQQHTDAIFNTINTDMNMRNAGRISSAIAEASGHLVEDECAKLSPQPGGSAVITNGGKLKARHIIHLVPLSSDKHHLQMCLENGLRLAEKCGLHSISVPAIGTGGYGLTATHSANMIFQALENVGKDCVSIRQVNIVVFNDEKIHDAFKIEKDKLQQNVRVDRIETQPMTQSECKEAKVKDVGIAQLSESQVNLLMGEAQDLDIQMVFDATKNCIKVRGDASEVQILVPKIYEEIIQRREELQDEQEEENAKMISKIVQWSYETKDGMETQFDLRTNYNIELAHNKGKTSVTLPFKDDNFSIDLREMTAMGQQYGEAIILKRNRKDAEGVPLPEHWSPMTTDEDFEAVQLDTRSKEYQQVANKLLSAAKANLTIKRIERIQNLFKYKKYMLTKLKMEERKHGGSNEKHLFHGTSSKSFTSINKEGFDRGYTGIHGKIYGSGVYFARDARYSESYTEADDNGDRYMYLARVLVGSFCQGTPEMKKPKVIDSNGYEISFDSTVNRTVNPTIFVVFTDDQCYPDYLITFR
ncbi:Poly [ADP-ribose] polymerase 14 [Stylophora pistillata]|uniref:Poly [ADP-ribose] polymerase n=1 Tax=Stylophora pistillata TaxID=50429 RepID=A0A2B4S0H5_STYPI|nr:Poly [ADP-ribose] polymerase 14 [Stylophora pistillata]